MEVTRDSLLLREYTSAMTKSEKIQPNSAGSVLMEGEPEAVKYAGQLLKPQEGIEAVNFDDDDIIEADGFSFDAVDGPASGRSDVVDSTPFSAFKSFFEQNFSYKMSHLERGCFLIFNQEIFDSHLGLESRPMARKEAHSMYHTAKNMGYEYIQIFNDCTKSDISDWLKAVSKASHSVYDSFGCAILTYSNESGELYAKDATFQLSDCIAFYSDENCPTLAGKPKIFFIQADRAAMSSGDAFASNRSNIPMKTIAPTSPIQADILVACSTAPRCVSPRTNLPCSFFVEALYLCFSKYAKSLEIMQIMCRVNKLVRHRYDTYSIDDVHLKQIPSITSQLTAEVYLYKPVLDRKSQQCAMWSNQSESCELNSATADVLSTESQSTSNRLNGREEQPVKRQKSLRNWIRKSLRKKK